MATVVKGFLTRLGYKPGTVWNTPVVAGAGNQTEYVSESLTPDSQFIPDEQVSGKATKLFGDKGNELHSGDIVLDAKYEGIETLLAQAMGTAGVPTQIPTFNAYTHVFKPADSKEGIFGTLVLDKQFEVWEYPSVKVGGLTIDWVAGRRARITFNLIPSSLNVNTGAGTNNTTTVGTLSIPANRDFWLFSQLALDMSPTGGGAFIAADRAYISELHLTLNNNMPNDDVTTRYGTRVDEPVQNSWTEITGSVVFSKYMTENKAWFTAMMSKASQKVLITSTGPVGTGMGSNPFSLKCWMPDVQFSSGGANVGGPGRVPLNLSFMANRKLSVPTGFPATYSDALTIELVNQRATNPLL